jgi:hypothetical protein
MDMILFKEWTPDAPDLNNPGGLTQCDNVIAGPDCYLPHKSAFPLSASTLPSQPQGMFEASARIYAGGADRVLYMSDTLYTMVARSATLGTSSTYEWDFARFDDLIIGTRGIAPVAHTLGAATNFSTLATAGTAPVANFVGIINRFVVVSAIDTDGTPYVQWSGIDQPRNWPTPNTATATALQSGQQFFSAQYGQIYKIINGDQFGLVFQQNAITRVTYVGPPTVFQFDVIDTSHGLWWPTAAVKVGASTHFLGVDGFYATDGVSLNPTGANKVNRTFIEQATGRIRATYDDLHKCVMWTYADSATTRANNAFCLNLDTGTWTKLDLLTLSSGGITSFITGIIPFSDFAIPSANGPPRVGPFFYDSNFQLNTFGTSNPAAVTFTTSEMEINPGGFSRISRIKTMVNGATAGAISTVVKYRNDQADSYGPDGSVQSATARDSCTHWRTEARYHRITMRVNGTFTKIMGLEVEAFPTSAT